MVNNAKKIHFIYLFTSSLRLFTEVLVKVRINVKSWNNGRETHGKAKKFGFRV